MADPIEVKVITNANVYLAGAAYMGRALEIELPKVKVKTIDHKPLGMIGEMELPVGLEKMEAKIKWASLDPVVAAKAANPMKAVTVQARASLETHTTEGRTSEEPVVVWLKGRITTLDLGTMKQMEGAEVETPMSVTAVKLTVAAVDILEVDINTNTWKANGEDLLAKYKTNLGA